VRVFGELEATTTVVGAFKNETPDPVPDDSPLGLA
jgi:hypothetical protein